MQGAVAPQLERPRGLLRVQARYMRVNHQHRAAPLLCCGGQHFGPSTHNTYMASRFMLHAFVAQQIKAMQSMIEAGRTRGAAQHCKLSIFPPVSPLGYAGPSTLPPPQESLLRHVQVDMGDWLTRRHALRSSQGRPGQVSHPSSCCQRSAVSKLLKPDIHSVSCQLPGNTSCP